MVASPIDADCMARITCSLTPLSMQRDDFANANFLLHAVVDDLINNQTLAQAAASQCDRVIQRHGSVECTVEPVAVVVALVDLGELETGVVVSRCSC